MLSHVFLSLPGSICNANLSWEMLFKERLLFSQPGLRPARVYLSRLWGPRAQQQQPGRIFDPKTLLWAWGEATASLEQIQFPHPASCRKIYFSQQGLLGLGGRTDLSLQTMGLLVDKTSTER